MTQMMELSIRDENAIHDLLNSLVENVENMPENMTNLANIKTKKGRV